MIQICKEKVARCAIIVCIILHFIKCVFFFFLNTFIPNKILNILSKTKIDDNIHCFIFQIINLKLLGNLKTRIQIKKKLKINIVDHLKLPALKN
jgi:hypothetical protein